MAKDPNDKLLVELDQHYQMWTTDNDKRRTQKFGWNDITDAYYGKLPDDWPYQSKVVVPLIRTSLIEKNARILNSKLRGRLVPREGGDAIKAQINNSLLDFQWDNANDGGSMNVKMSISDIDARLYASKFAYIYWKYEKEGDTCLFDGNEMMPLSIENCGIDPTASHIRDANWFQMRTWEKFEDLENAVDSNGKKIYKNLEKVRTSINQKYANKRQSSRRNAYTPRILHLRGLEDRLGTDMAFPVVEKVTEFRNDKFITFLPEYGEIILDIKNPFRHRKIPIAQLRYHALQDDPLGESEVEPVLGLWRAIQATVNAYLDEMILKIRPPLKVIENAARVETIVYGAEAQWLVDRQDAIEEMRSSGDTLQYYQTTYQSMVSAFNTAMGDLSQGVSAFDPIQSGSEKRTAAEIKATVKQQNVRDQKNQNDLSEFIKDIMMMWVSNNQQFLFSDPSKKEYLLKIVGEDQYSSFKRAGLADMEMVPGSEEMIRDIIEQSGGDLSDDDILRMYEMGSMPKYPVVTNPNEKDPSKIEMKPKLTISEYGNVADLVVEPSDIEGNYDYIPDVRSMAIGASEELMQGRQNALQLLTTNPTVIQLLQQEGYKPKVKEIVSAVLEDSGLKDSERFFEKFQEAAIGANPQAMGGVGNPMQVPGVPAAPQTDITGGLQQQMARPELNGQAGTAFVPQL